MFSLKDDSSCDHLHAKPASQPFLSLSDQSFCQLVLLSYIASALQDSQSKNKNVSKPIEHLSLLFPPNLFLLSTTFSNSSALLSSTVANPYLSLHVHCLLFCYFYYEISASNTTQHPFPNCYQSDVANPWPSGEEITAKAELSINKVAEAQSAHGIFCKDLFLACTQGQVVMQGSPCTVLQLWPAFPGIEPGTLRSLNISNSGARLEKKNQRGREKLLKFHSCLTMGTKLWEFSSPSTEDISFSSAYCHPIDCIHLPVS